MGHKEGYKWDWRQWGKKDELNDEKVPTERASSQEKEKIKGKKIEMWKVKGEAYY